MSTNDTLRTAEDLLYLISCAVNGEAPEPDKVDGMDLPEVFMMAFRHKLTVAAASALKQVIPLPEYWKEERGKAVRRQVLVDLERQKVLQRLTENEIWYLPLKGIILKDYYPSASMREMSDNDILCDSEKMSDIRSIMTDMGYSSVEYEQNNHDVYRKYIAVFEFHRALFDYRRAPLFSRYYASVKDRLIRDENNRFGYHMKDEDFYIYMIVHMYKHYSNAGTGLRSLLDIYVYHQKMGPQLDWDYILPEFRELGVDEFEKKLRILAERVFTRQELSEAEQKELMYFIDSNCYGLLVNKIGNKLNNDDSKKAKLSYIYRRIFPTEEYLKYYCPVVYRHRILYPFFVIYRPFRGLFTKRKKLYREYKALRQYRNKR